MKINISKCDAIHILNWLSAFKRMCNDPKVGMHYLTDDIECVMDRLVGECKPSFPDIRIAKDGHVFFGTGKDFWWIDRNYSVK